MHALWKTKPDCAPLWDVYLTTDDEQRVHANRHVLTAFSTYFGTLFGAPDAASLQHPCHVRIPGLRGDVLRSMVEQMYSGQELELSELNVTEYLEAGSHLQVWRPPWRVGKMESGKWGSVGAVGY